jgi:hypothetical protein
MRRWKLLGIPQRADDKRCAEPMQHDTRRLMRGVAAATVSPKRSALQKFSPLYASKATSA